MSPENPPSGTLTPTERFLRLFTDVRAGEGVTGILMLANVFLILTAYYLVKPVREGWLAISVIRDLSKMEVKAVSGFGQSLLLLGIVPLYGLLYGRLAPRRLVLSVNLFMVAALGAFWFLQPGFLVAGLPYAGLSFYLWVGIFGVLIVAQFWAFAADLYTQEGGKRLFPLIAIGASGGAVAGAWLAGLLMRIGLDSFSLLPAALIPLLASTWLTVVADRRGPLGQGRVVREEPTAGPGEEEGNGGRGGAFRLIFGSRYLIAAAFLVLAFSWVNTNGENVLFGAVQAGIEREISASGLTDPAAVSRIVRVETTSFYGDLYFWVNLCGLLMQAFLASRVLKFGGFGAILLVAPFVSLTAYAAMFSIPLIGVIKVMKIAENSSNYSLNNTARHVLWLPTTRAMKYKAKAAVDTLFARIGDGMAALTVIVGTRIFSAGIRQFFAVNMLLALLWILLGILLIREHRHLGRSPLPAEGTVLPAREG